jgi:glycerate 2-kinase
VVTSPPARAGKDLLLEAYAAAIAAAAPGEVTTRAIDELSIARGSRVWLFSFGKAAQPMAAAAVASLLRSLHSIVGGVVVSAEGGAAPYPTLVSMRGDHPIPGRNSFAAAAKIGEAALGHRGSDVVIVLLSGGATSLIGAPLRGMNESDFTLLFEMLLESGLDIAAMNAVRKRFSRWGAGRFALALAPASTHCLAISDVAGDDLGVIGSGPCAPDETTVKDVTAILQRANLFSRIPQTYRDYLTGVERGTIPETPTKAHPAFAHVSSKVIGNNDLAVSGAAAFMLDHGRAAELAPARLSGEAARAGEWIARALIAAHANTPGSRCMIWGGETTVTILERTGASASGGGRCQELALAAARVLHDAGESARDIVLLAAGTDGRDGATDAAGAVVDATTWDAIADSGRDPSQSLASHESHSALRAAGALIPRRTTGTNVNDVVIGLA